MLVAEVNVGSQAVLVLDGWGRSHFRQVRLHLVRVCYKLSEYFYNLVLLAYQRGYTVGSLPWAY